jgi:hypothetical protein
MLEPASLVFCLLDGVGMMRAQNLEVFILANFIRPATFQKYILHSLVGQVSRQHNSSLLVPNILMLPCPRPAQYGCTNCARLWA